MKVSSTSETSHSVPTPNPKCADVCLLVVGTLGAEPQSKKVKAKKTKPKLNGNKWQSQSNREQGIISSTSLLGRFMREGEQRFPWRKDKEADYDILYFIVLPEMELRALFSALIYCVKH